MCSKPNTPERKPDERVSDEWLNLSASFEGCDKESMDSENYNVILALKELQSRRTEDEEPLIDWAHTQEFRDKMEVAFRQIEDGQYDTFDSFESLIKDLIQRTKDKEPSGPYKVVWDQYGSYPEHARYLDATGKEVDPETFCAMLNARPESVEGLQELADLWKWADAVLDGFCGGKQTPELTRKYKIRRKAFNDFHKTLTALGVNLD